MPDSTAPSFFVSYSHHDADWRAALFDRCIATTSGDCLVWSDAQLRAGDAWCPQIEAQLAACSVAVLLVSPNFLASSFIRERELPLILARAAAGTLRIVWIPIALDRDTLPGSPLFRRNLLFYRDTALVTMPVAIATQSAIASFFPPSVVRRIGVEGPAVSGHFGYVESPTNAPVRNVVAVLPGSDPKLRGQYVAIGAHADHVGIIGDPVDHDSIRAFNAVARPRGADDPPPRQVTDSQWILIRALIDSLHRAHGGPRLDSIANGADDDGSGTVLALEIAEAFAKGKRRPARSLLFVWHAAEEQGLYGAQYFSDHPTVSRDSIVAQINMDQMGRGGAEDAPPDGLNSMVVLGARRLSSELGRIADSVNGQPRYQFHMDRSFDQPGDPSHGWCRSDHYMYARYGIPVLFFVSAVWYIDYHMVSDEPQYINYPRLAKVGNYIHDVTAQVANLPHRPVVDGARPDPRGACIQ